MASIRVFILGLALALASWGASANTYHVTVWNGLADCSGGAACLFDADQADVPVPGDTPLAEFDFTSTLASGDLNWATSSGAFNTYGDFLDGGTLSNFTGTVSQGSFLSMAMSVEGNQFASYFAITGAYSTGSDFTRVIMHDDGSSLYVDGSAIFQAPGRVTGQVTSGPYNFLGGTHDFQLLYIAADGGPAVLQFGLPGAVAAAVPEPATLGMMALALIIVAVVLRKRQSRR